MPMLVFRGVHKRDDAPAYELIDIVQGNPGSKVASPAYYGIFVVGPSLATLRARWKGLDPAPYRKRFEIRYDAIPNGIKNARYTVNGFSFLVVGSSSVNYGGQTFQPHATWAQFRKFVRDKVLDVTEEDRAYTPEGA